MSCRITKEGCFECNNGGALTAVMAMGAFSVYGIMVRKRGIERFLARRRIKPMERYLFDQNVIQYFEWLRNVLLATMI